MGLNQPAFPILFKAECPETAAIPEQAKDQDQETFECCGKTFTGRRSIRMHEYKRHWGPQKNGKSPNPITHIKAQPSDSGFKTYSNVKAGVNNSIGGVSVLVKYQCDSCEIVYDNEDDMAKHRETCSSELINNYDLEYRDLDNTGGSSPPVFHCDMCEKLFWHKSSLQRHKREMHAESNKDDDIVDASNLKCEIPEMKEEPEMEIGGHETMEPDEEASESENMYSNNSQESGLFTDFEFVLFLIWVFVSLLLLPKFLRML